VSASKPVIVLVRPQLGQNIGKTARAMLNFGLTEMQSRRRALCQRR
jgi:tRNA/rRNA methyltransferase